MTPEQWELARAWRAQGASDAEIGRRLKVAHTTISRGLGPRGQAPDAGEGEPGWAPAEPLFTGPGAGAKLGLRLRLGRGCGGSAAWRRAAWPVGAAGGAFRSRYAGAMLLHAFFGAGGCRAVLAAAAGEPGGRGAAVGDQHVLRARRGDD